MGSVERGNVQGLTLLVQVPPQFPPQVQVREVVVTVIVSGDVVSVSGTVLIDPGAAG